MKTRKITALLLCLLLVASCLLVACDQSGEDTSSGSTGTTSSTNSNNSGTDAKYLDANGRYWPSYSDSISESIIGDRTEFRVLVTTIPRKRPTIRRKSSRENMIQPTRD